MTNQATPKILDATAVDALLPGLDVKSELTTLFQALGTERAVQPPQTITDFPNAKGDFITYLGAVADMGVFGAKLSPYIVTDATPVITAWTCLMSMETGDPLMWCDSGRLTIERTAGTTALAVDLLAPANAHRLAIIGSGAVAEAHFQHVQDLRNWTSVTVYSPGLIADPERQAKWRSFDGKIEIAADSSSCLTGCDVVMLCTSSGTPVIDPKDTGKPSLFTSISTNVANAHEVAPDFLPLADVFCDYLPTTPGSAGEMKLATAAGDWSADQICGDLAQLVCGTCPKPNYEKSVFFRSIGLGLEDIAMAHGIYKLSQIY
ncbi:ornithine cyclodeaminase family protein [uncultured Ruegeria sp.]|uniref:ornithine cyclodeaminase family protein n=1 Tax=uncultured Ruegeria sp. TaxID=259304 RepID=UPI002620C6BB|nr:ornithine cyclodeaminase family protein [uncultured Ruegeria sp.]